MDCYLAVVEGLVCLCDPANSAGRGLASGRCNQAGKINGERPDKRAAKKKKKKKTIFKKKIFNCSMLLQHFLASHCKVIYKIILYLLVIVLTKAAPAFFLWCDALYRVYYVVFLRLIPF